MNSKSLKTMIVFLAIAGTLQAKYCWATKSKQTCVCKAEDDKCIHGACDPKQQKGVTEQQLKYSENMQKLGAKQNEVIANTPLKKAVEKRKIIII